MKKLVEARAASFVEVTLLPVVVGLLVGLGTALAHDDSGPHKKLFDHRWYQQLNSNDYGQWMTLTTSQLFVDCLFPSSCESRWLSPANLAISDWNAQDTTVQFEIMSDQSPEYDVNIHIVDAIGDDPSVLGRAIFFDSNVDICVTTCTIRYGDIVVSDLAHSFDYGTSAQRKVTIAHEAGHLLSLAHESVNEDESVSYTCGEDNTGPIPHSIMAYDCTDPISVGGFGETYVHEWDVCGVNHAYYDPSVGYAGCAGETPATPTNTFTATPTATPCSAGSGSSAGGCAPATPSNTPTEFGDTNCDGVVNPLDAAIVLQRAAGLIPSLPCPAIADVSQDGAINPLDAALILQYSAGLLQQLGPPATPAPVHPTNTPTDIPATATSTNTPISTDTAMPAATVTPTSPLICCNDNFADALVIDAFPFSAEQDTLGSTVEPGEYLNPPGCLIFEPNQKGATVWYRFIAPASGVVTASTAGSDFDTVLAVYTGDSIATKDPLACDDDSGPGTLSEMNLSVTEGLAYYLQVGGFGGRAGNLVLTVDFFANAT